MATSSSKERFGQDGRDPGSVRARFVPNKMLGRRLSSRRFMASAETLSPFPDGVRVPKVQQCSPNPSLMDTISSFANRSDADILCTSKSFSGLNFTESYDCSGLHSSHVTDLPIYLESARPADSVGYWKVTYLLSDGETVGKSKVMAPRGNSPYSFESILDAIKQNAGLLNFVVRYIMYLDRDFKSYALLTPHNAQNCTDSFHVVVESRLGGGLESGETHRKGSLKGSSSSHNSETEKSLNESPGKATNLLFRTPIMHFHVPCHVDVSDSKLESLLLEKEGTFLDDEAAERKAIISEESSLRLILQASEAVRLHYMLKTKGGKSKPSITENVSVKEEKEIEISADAPTTPTTNNTEKSNIENTVSTSNDVLFPIMTSFRIVLEGDKWGALLTDERYRLCEAMTQDISSCLDIPRENIVTERGNIGEPLLIIKVQHDGSRTYADLQSKIIAYEFPNLVQVNAALHCSTTTTTATENETNGVQNTTNDNHHISAEEDHNTETVCTSTEFSPGNEIQDTFVMEFTKGMPVASGDNETTYLSLTLRADTNTTDH